MAYVLTLFSVFLLVVPIWGYAGCLADSFENAFNLDIVNKLSPRATVSSDAEWANAQFRWGAPKELSESQKIYLQNVDASVNETFLPAFEKGDFAKDWMKITQDQHVMMVKGKGEYKGLVNGASSDKDVKEFAGVFRKEGDYESGSISLDLSNADSHLKYEDLKNTAAIVEIKGVPKEAWPTNVNKSWHEYPDVKFIPAYQKRAQELATELTEAVKKKENVEHILETLSDYYHVTINAHMFPKVNNSLFMGQVNGILSKLGLKPLSHGNLDYIALINGTDDFREVFIGKIKAMNDLW